MLFLDSLTLLYSVFFIICLDIPKNLLWCTFFCFFFFAKEITFFAFCSDVNKDFSARQGQGLSFG